MLLNPLKTLPPNIEGRDFVIGDLHGSGDCLIQLLDGIKFDTSVDRLISVGDLVDRGGDSLQCLQLLTEPWFHAVMGNHEQLMLEAFRGGRLGQYWFQNGGFWGINAISRWWKEPKLAVEMFGADLDPSVNVTDGDASLELPLEDELALYELLPMVRELPFIITIERPDGKKFHVLHAELPSSPTESVKQGWEGWTDEHLANPAAVRELAELILFDGTSALLWSRREFGFFAHENIQNIDKAARTVKSMNMGKHHAESLSHILSGHTIQQRPLSIGKQTCLDTGAYRTNDKDPSNWAGLTCVELGTWTFYHATPTSFRQVEPLDLNRPISDSQEQA